METFEESVRSSLNPKCAIRYPSSRWTHHIIEALHAHLQDEEDLCGHPEKLKQDEEVIWPCC